MLFASVAAPGLAFPEAGRKGRSADRSHTTNPLPVHFSFSRAAGVSFGSLGCAPVSKAWKWPDLGQEVQEGCK